MSLMKWLKLAFIWEDGNFILNSNKLSISLIWIISIFAVQISINFYTGCNNIVLFQRKILRKKKKIFTKCMYPWKISRDHMSHVDVMMQQSIKYSRLQDIQMLQNWLNCWYHNKRRKSCFLTIKTWPLNKTRPKSDLNQHNHTRLSTF